MLWLTRAYALSVTISSCMCHTVLKPCSSLCLIHYSIQLRGIWVVLNKHTTGLKKNLCALKIHQEIVNKGDGDSSALNKQFLKCTVQTHVDFVSQVKPVRMNLPSVCPSSELWGELERAVSCKWNHNSFHPRLFFFTCCCELTWAILKPKCNHNLLMISRPVLPSSRKVSHPWFIKASERLKVTLSLLQQMSLVGETETLRLWVS